MYYRIYRSFLALSIISCAISVSLSQLFLVISFVLFLFLDHKPKFNSSISKALFLFYLWQIVTVLFHYFSSGFEWITLQNAFKNEMKDMFLVSAFFAIQGIKKEDYNFLYKTLFIFALVVLVSGFISIFSMTRLARLISDMYKMSASWPYQHHYGKILGLNIYLPIGLMNTHLTFGGLLAFVYPLFFFRTYDSWFHKEPKKQLFINFLLLVFISIVFLFNNARSSLLGMFLSVSFGLYIIIFVDREISKKIIKRFFLITTMMFLVIFISYQSTNAVKRVIDPLFGGEKHTDSGRTFIWDSTFPLIQNNFIFGIGAGNYQKEIEISRKERSKENKDLSFFYEVTQRGHAHNDYFHLASVFGIPQVFFYFLLMFTILHAHLNGIVPRKNRYVTYGLTGFFFSGLLQCYFQDDEVLIVFMFLLGYLNLFLNKDEYGKIN
ncbi:O-antigen ligase family protein [Leptospira sp. 96542]|nr:O-antigen ligase family protein [Leptospira sp. 96542]